MFVLGYSWLPLATIGLVGDNKEFGSLSTLLWCYTHHRWPIVLGLRRFVIVCPLLPMVAPSAIELVGDNR